MTRWITATKIHDGIKFLPEDTVIGIDEHNVITYVGTTPSEVLHMVTRYEGILIPKFINAHCHLELSHLYGMIPKHEGLISFIKNVMTLRGKVAPDAIQSAIKRARDEAWHNGIIAIGDICNTTDTLPIKKVEKNMYFHSFIEGLGILEEQALVQWERLDMIANSFLTHAHSLVPHAPYSVSDYLMYQIMKHKGVKSIHMEESGEERIWMMEGKGGFATFYDWLGLDTNKILLRNKSSWHWVKEHNNHAEPILLVHGTHFTKKEWEEIGTQPNTFVCLCPNANLYIENILPEVESMQLFIENICIGTDSLASNDKLCVFSELKTIHRFYNNISWETLIRWGTYHGAKALRIDNVYGRIAEGRALHINLLETLEGEPHEVAIVA